MSPEERRHTLCHALRTADCNYNIDGKPVTQLAADDLERLTEELRITNKALSMCSDECNKLYEKYDKKLDELERLTTLKQSDAEPQGVRALEAKCYAEGFADGKKATLAQSNAEPVAWQYRWKMKLFDGGIEWSPWHDLPHGCVERYAELPDYETRALYTAPPRPDASAGLIEAAGWLEKRMTDAYIGTPDFQKGKIYGISLAVDHLRSLPKNVPRCLRAEPLPGEHP